MGEELPKFTEHAGHAKLQPLVHPKPPSQFVREFLDDQLDGSGRPRGDYRVLDVGCGRGDTVAWLCEQGWDAYGLDLEPRYLEQGRPYFESAGYGNARLRLLTDRYPFADATFDVVLSDQVVEHVVDLDAFFAEVARVTRKGGLGLHVFPARWRPVESHLRVPLVHWLPKGPARRRILLPLLALGLSAPYFSDRPLLERVQIFGSYSDTETFYRSLPELRRTCELNGLAPDLTSPALKTVAARLPQLPHALAPLAAWLYRQTFSVRLQTRRPA